MLFMTLIEPSTSPTFGELLRRWRQSQHLSQGGFGALLTPQARHSTVSCWEKGIRRPAARFLGQIVALTGIPAHLALGVDAADRVAPPSIHPLTSERRSL
jgi:transcriptional regulator with XRE-family HTH domain